MKTMTIRNIPDDVATWLSDQAAASRMSVNQTTVAVLVSAARPQVARKRRDLSGIFGTWKREDAARFDHTIQEAFGTVNPADWKDPE